jgi:hypothetical protein
MCDVTRYVASVTSEACHTCDNTNDQKVRFSQHVLYVHIYTHMTSYVDAVDCTRDLRVRTHMRIHKDTCTIRTRLLSSGKREHVLLENKEKQHIAHEGLNAHTFTYTHTLHMKA